jgi:hypothetical protein
MTTGRNWREVKAEAHRRYPEMADPARIAAAVLQFDAYLAEHPLEVAAPSPATSPIEHLGLKILR